MISEIGLLLASIPGRSEGTFLVSRAAWNQGWCFVDFELLASFSNNLTVDHFLFFSTHCTHLAFWYMYMDLVRIDLVGVDLVKES